MPLPDKRVTIDDVVAELRDGMTDRHRRMGLAAQADGARARDRSARRCSDLTVVSYGGPDVGLLCATGKVTQGRLRVRVARLDRARAALPQRPPGRRGRRRSSSTRACSSSGCRPRRGGCRSCRPASGSAPTSSRVNPRSARSRSPYADGEELVAMPALDLDVALVHMHRGDQGGNGQYLERRPVLRRPHAAWPRRGGS